MEDAKQIVTTLKRHGTAYIVGGAVRDHLLGKECDDIDIATNVPMEKIEVLFETYDIGKNKDFGVAVIKFNNKIYEIANFRKDGTYSDGRHPDSVEVVDTFEEDCKRRDFTINALGLDTNGDIIDHVGGLIDLNKRVIRCIGDSNVRFEEDFLRMLRAVRFAVTLDFTLNVDVKIAIFNNASKILAVSKERIFKELYKMACLSGKQFSKAIVLMNDLKLLEWILPEIASMEAYEHHREYHPEGGVFDHTVEAIKSYKGDDPRVNLSILFHDIGKIITRVYREGKVTYYGHGKAGVALIKERCKDLKFPNYLIDCIAGCAKDHMKFHKFLEMNNNKVTNLINSENWEVLLQVAYADDICRGTKPNDWDKINERITNVYNKYVKNQAYTRIKRTINGKRIMELTGITEGPEIGRIKRKTIEWIVDNSIDVEDVGIVNNFILKSSK